MRLLLSSTEIALAPGVRKTTFALCVLAIKPSHWFYGTGFVEHGHNFSAKCNTDNIGAACWQYNLPIDFMGVVLSSTDTVSTPGVRKTKFGLCMSAI